MYKFLYNYVKINRGEKEKQYYMDTDSFIVYIKTEDISVDIAKNINTRFDTSNYEIGRTLPKGRKEKK